VLFLGLQDIFCDEKREVGILNTNGFDLSVKPVFDFIPNSERPRAKNVATCEEEEEEVTGRGRKMKI
jgi:hypothetical protein